MPIYEWICMCKIECEPSSSNQEAITTSDCWYHHRKHYTTPFKQSCSFNLICKILTEFPNYNTIQNCWKYPSILANWSLHLPMGSLVSPQFSTACSFLPCCLHKFVFAFFLPYVIISNLLFSCSNNIKKPTVKVASYALMYEWASESKNMKGRKDRIFKDVNCLTNKNNSVSDTSKYMYMPLIAPGTYCQVWQYNRFNLKDLPSI